MAATGKHRGHPIRGDGKRWRYVDNDEPTAETHMTRPCGECGKFSTPEGHDPCIGTLPGVMNACCGHGEQIEAYVQYAGGDTVRGVDAIRRLGIEGLP